MSLEMSYLVSAWKNLLFQLKAKLSLFIFVIVGQKRVFRTLLSDIMRLHVVFGDCGSNAGKKTRIAELLHRGVFTKWLLNFLKP